MEQEKKHRFKRLRRFRRRFKRPRIDLRKGLFVIPHIFTFSNACCGFIAFILAMRGSVVHAAAAILVGAVMDVCDGRTARLFRTESEFGVQLDSLSDVITFCCAPALLAYSWHLHRLGILGGVISFLFLMAGMTRLARFNIIHQQQTIFFLGLPTTMAGCFLVTVIMNATAYSASPHLLAGLSAVMLTLSFLMVSSLPFPTFKKRLFTRPRLWHAVAALGIAGALPLIKIRGVLLVVFLSYFIYALHDAHRQRRTRRRAARNGS